jgi:hypothetical protein
MIVFFLREGDDESAQIEPERMEKLQEQIKMELIEEMQQETRRKEQEEREIAYFSTNMYLIRGRTLFSCFFEPNFSCSTPATK